DDDVLERVGGGDGHPVVLVDVRDQRLDGRGVGGVHDAQLGLPLGRADGGGGRGDGLGVGGVAARVAGDEGVFAGGRGRQELLRGRAAHRARRGEHDLVADAEPVEGADVGLAVLLVGVLEAVVVEVERVGVLHEELAAAQDAGPGPGLVAVLGLDLVERDRVVLVGGVFALDHVGEELLVGGPEQVVGALAVVEPEERVAVLRPAAGGLVVLAGQQRGEEHLLGAHPVHLLADDAGDVLKHDLAQGQSRIDAGGHPSDVAGANEELVARHFRVCRVVPQVAKKQRRHAQQHDYSLLETGCEGLQAIDSEKPSARGYQAGSAVNARAKTPAATAAIVRARARAGPVRRSASTATAAMMPTGSAGSGQKYGSAMNPGVARWTTSVISAAPMTPAARSPQRSSLRVAYASSPRPRSRANVQ